MKIFVLDIKGNKKQFEINPNDKVKSLIEKLKDENKVDDKAILLFNEKFLNRKINFLQLI